MEIVINYLMETTINLFEIYIIYKYMTIFFDNQFADKKLALLAYIMRFVSASVLNILIVSPMVNAIISIIGFFMIALCYLANVKKKIIVTVMVYMCFFMAEVVVALAIGVRGFDPFGQIVQKDELMGVIIQCVNWMFTLILQKFKNIGTDVRMPKVFVIALVVVSVSVICLNVLIFQQQNVNRNMASISIVCSLSSIFVMIYLYDSISKIFQVRTQAELVLREKEYYLEQSELLMQRQEELQKFRHDMKNRFIAIQQMLSNKKYENVLEYTGKIVEKLSRLENYSATGYLVIDSVINYKLTRAAQMGVKVDSHISIPECVQIAEDDIVVILGNVLDNAIEATEQLMTEKYISLDMEYEKGCVFIHIKNNYDLPVRISDGKFITQKKDSHLHGIGLKSVNSIVEKYNGLLEIEKKNQEFAVDILLYV